jgi:hypothetical protein
MRRCIVGATATALLILGTSAFRAAPKAKLKRAPPAAPAAKPTEDECTLDGKALTARLPARHAAFVGKVKLTREPHETTETVSLKDGTKLTLTQGGCEHIAITYELAGIVDATKITDRAHYFPVASALLRQKLGAKGDALDTMVADAIDRMTGKIEIALAETKAAKDGGAVRAWEDCNKADECSTSFSCGDATCGVHVRREDPMHVSVAGTYDFAL